MARFTLVQGDRSALEYEGLRRAFDFDVEGLRSVVERLSPRGQLVAISRETGACGSPEPPVEPAFP